MTVLVANDTPAAIRGMLKRWFVEPKPNVFVGTVNRRTRATGSPTISSIGNFSSTIRLTKEVLAPFSSRRRTR